VIVVEGFDGSGKSTLAKAIGNRLTWPVLHTGGPTSDKLDVSRCLDRSIQRIHQACVQDRITHVSEAVYSAFRYYEKSAMAIEAIPYLPSVVFIYCRPSVLSLMRTLHSHQNKSWDTNEHMQFVVANAGHLIALYDTITHMIERRFPDTFYRYDRDEPFAFERMMDTVMKRFAL
jgi:hypothetical protein